MKLLAYIVLITLATLLNAGCATIVIRTDISGSKPKGLYPATRADVTGTIRYCRGELDLFWSDAGSSRPNIIEKILWATFATIDLPISIVTDTVCLPWDIAKKRRGK